jgi:hypothetical protein
MAIGSAMRGAAVLLGLILLASQPNGTAAWSQEALALYDLVEEVRAHLWHGMHVCFSTLSLLHFEMQDPMAHAAWACINQHYPVHPTALASVDQQLPPLARVGIRQRQRQCEK